MDFPLKERTGTTKEDEGYEKGIRVESGKAVEGERLESGRRRGESWGRGENI